MVKFGIISDTHVNETEDTLEINKLFEKIKQIFEDVDEIIHAGDICSNYFLGKLEKIKPIRCVSGNMDKIGNLKKFLSFHISVYKIGVIHIPPNNLEKFSRDKNLNILIHGHTHQPLIQGTEFNLLILNPGSPRKPRAPPQKIGFKEPIARKTVMTLEINEKNDLITTYLINI